jgi:uncharacterized protein (DUF2336 family)
MTVQAGRLNAADVERLLGDRSDAARETVVRKVAAEIDNAALGQAERGLAIDILHRMADDVAVTVRAALAESIATSPFLPRDLARKLAGDVAHVALPVLQFATILSDGDLLAMIGGGDPAKLQAIARRASVSEQVSHSLIEQGDEASVSTLLANQGAKIAEHSLSHALDRFGDSAAVQESMARRAQLPLAVTERLITLVSEQFKHYLLANHKVSLSVATDTVVQSRERALMAITEGARTGQELERLIRQLKDNGRLTPSLVLRALCLGDTVFFEHSIAALGDIPLSNARLLIHDAGPLGLKSVLERARLPDALLPAVRAALTVARETPTDDAPGGLAAFRRRMIERVLTHVEAIDGEDADYLLAKLSDLSEMTASLRHASSR